MGSIPLGYIGSISSGGAGTGDMTKAVYDPTGVNGNAFDMSKMTETATAKVFTDEERQKLALGFSTEVVKISAPLGSYEPYITYLADSSGGEYILEFPDVTAGDDRAYAVQLYENGFHVGISTVGGTQLIGGKTIQAISTIGTSLTIKANGVDGYDILRDARDDKVVILLESSVDLSTGIESNAVYRCISPTSSAVNIVIPDTSVQHEGQHCKFILDTDNGTSVHVSTSSSESIGESSEQSIITPFKGFEVLDHGDGYMVTQDSRPNPSDVAINFYPSSDVSVLEPTYSVMYNMAFTEEVVTTAPITATTYAGAQSLGFFINDDKALVGNLSEREINGYGYLKKTSDFNRDIRIYFKYYEYDYGTLTLNPTPLNTTASSGVIDNYQQFDQYFVAGTLAANTWALTSSEGHTLVAELMAYKVGTGGVDDDPTLDFRAGGDTPSRTAINVPVASVNHATLGGVTQAATGTPDGHIDNDIPLQFPELTTSELATWVSTGDPKIGQEAFNTTTGMYQQYNGSAFVDRPTGSAGSPSSTNVVADTESVVANTVVNTYAGTSSITVFAPTATPTHNDTIWLYASDSTQQGSITLRNFGDTESIVPYLSYVGGVTGVRYSSVSGKWKEVT